MSPAATSTKTLRSQYDVRNASSAFVFGYIAWLLRFGTYFWPRLKVMDRADAQRVALAHFGAAAE